MAALSTAALLLLLHGCQHWSVMHCGCLVATHSRKSAVVPSQRHANAPRRSLRHSSTSSDLTQPLNSAPSPKSRALNIP